MSAASWAGRFGFERVRSLHGQTGVLSGTRGEERTSVICFDRLFVFGYVVLDLLVAVARVAKNNNSDGTGSELM